MVHCYLIGDAGLGKTTTYNFLTNSNERISHGVDDGTLSCSTGCLDLIEKEIKITDTPGINDSKNLTTWWGGIHNNSKTNLILFFINGTTIRNSSNINVNEIINFCSQMEYRMVFLYIHKIPSEVEKLLPNKEIDYFLLQDKDLIKKDFFQKGDKITRGDLRNYINSLEMDVEFEFVSPLFVIKMHNKILQITGEIMGSYKNLKKFISINDENSNDILTYLESYMEIFKKLVDYQLKITKELDDYKKKLDVKMKLCNESIGDTLKSIEKVKSKFIEKDGDDEKKKIKSWGHHAYSWLPFVGNINLEQMRNLQDYCSGELMKVLNLEKELEKSKKQIEEFCLSKMDEELGNKIGDAQKKEGSIKQDIDSLKINLEKTKTENIKFEKDMERIKGIINEIE